MAFSDENTDEGPFVLHWMAKNMIAWLKLVEGIHARKEDVSNENFLRDGKKMAAVGH